MTVGQNGVIEGCRKNLTALGGRTHGDVRDSSGLQRETNSLRLLELISDVTKGRHSARVTRDR